MPRLLLSTLFSFALSTLSGCADRSATENAPTSSTAATTSTKKGAPLSDQQSNTPQAVYAAVAKAANNKDYKTVATLLTKDSQIAMAAGMIFLAESEATSYGSDLNELKELLGRHGINHTSTRPLNLPPGASQKTVMEAIAKPVKDLPAFLGEMGAWKAKNGHAFVGGFPELRELSKVTIDGDSAKGVCQSNMGPQLIAFRKVNGAWKFHTPTDVSPSDLEALEPDDGTPALGTLSSDDKEVKLRHATAYESKFLDEPCVTVLLTQYPIYDRDMNELKDKLRDSDDLGASFNARGPHMRLILDTKGKLRSMFAWIVNGYEEMDNKSDGIDLDVKVEGNRVHGTAGLAPKEDSKYRFQAKFDVEILQVDRAQVAAPQQAPKRP
uniref:Lipoprotein n=1 Tax=uncultured bacterium FLS18 TaxID=654935 RepID=C6G3Z9_9BACT|nr:hypothetical protein [uncultured bacterium FLS18]